MKFARKLFEPWADRWSPELVPSGFVIVMIAVSAVWNQREGISWQPPLMVWLAAPAVLLIVAAIYTIFRPAPVIAEIAFYAALWILYPVFATRLTYLSVAAGYPLTDAALNGMDAALGFDWARWAKFNLGHPLFLISQQFCYLSYAWQPVLTIPVLALWRPRWGNAAFLTAMLIGMLLTLGITTFTPALGPAVTLGLDPPWAPVIRALRAAPEARDLPYLGIVNFPSYHAVMAVLFIEAHRGLRWSFPVVLVFNILMLISIPFCGTHYLIDVAGGIAVAVCAIGVVRYFPMSLARGDPDGWFHRGR